MQLEQDTIVAISTPPGRGGIGVVRVSGGAAREVAAGVVRLKGELAAGRARVGVVVDAGGEVLDECVVTYFAGPRSYTGEDVVEIAGHGAPVLLEAVLRGCCAGGARLAEPGEFTRRAFLNGRMDLTQAEAVRDLIEAQTAHQARVAAAQLGGAVARAVGPAKDELVGLIAGLEAGVDFAEDDLELMAEGEIVGRIDRIVGELERLAGTFAYGRLVRDGFTLALVGAPNAGKSSLFNALVGRERSIVTAEAGTTRDTVTERVAIGGIPVTLVDTAGLREVAGGEAEAIGMARTREAMAEADLVVVVSCGEEVAVEGEVLRVWSKCDLEVGIRFGEVEGGGGLERKQIAFGNENREGGQGLGQGQEQGQEQEQEQKQISFGNDNQEDRQRQGQGQRLELERKQIPFGNDKQEDRQEQQQEQEQGQGQEQEQKQIPFGNDNQEDRQEQGQEQQQEQKQIPFGNDNQEDRQGQQQEQEQGQTQIPFGNDRQEGGRRLEQRLEQRVEKTQVCLGKDDLGIRTSAVTGEGIEELRGAIVRALGGGGGESGMVTNLRQFEAISGASAGLRRARAAVGAGVPHEMVLLDLYGALGGLDELTGATGGGDPGEDLFGVLCGEVSSSSCAFLFEPAAHSSR